MKRIKILFVILLAAGLPACGGGVENGREQFVAAREEVHKAASEACSTAGCSASDTEKHVRGADSTFRSVTIEEYKSVLRLKELPGSYIFDERRIKARKRSALRHIKAVHNE